MPAYFGQFGYSAWKYDADRLCEVEERTVDKVEAAMARCGASHAAVQGTSGTWVVPAMIKAGIPVIMVRKPGELCHGSEIEGSHGVVTSVVFVDDFVCSGSTRRLVEQALAQYGIPVLATVEHSPQ